MHAYRDAIWNWFGVWGPFIRDVVSLGLAGLGSYLAYLAIRMGKEQGQIAKRQTEIAENQHQMMQEQLAKKADIVMLITDRSRDGFRGCQITLRNKGSLSVSRVEWGLIYLRTEADAMEDLKFYCAADHSTHSEPHPFHVIKGSYQDVILAGDERTIGSFMLKFGHPRTELEFHGHARWDGGRWPAAELTTPVRIGVGLFDDPSPLSVDH